MRYTEKLVREVAVTAEKITKGEFRLQAVGGDIGHGVRYIDGVQQLAWLGRIGAREAAAYYAAATEEWHVRSGGLIADLPQVVQDVLNDLWYRNTVRAVTAAYRRGMNDARCRFGQSR